MPENEDAERIYLMTRDQAVISPLGNTIAPNHMAIHAAMDLYEVYDRRDCFEKVLMLNRHFMGKSK